MAFVATLSGVPSHTIVAQGLEALRNLDHRGATGADPRTGDGAGILIQVPDAFLRAEAGFELPEAGAYAVGNAFLPQADDAAATARQPGSRRSPPRSPSTCSAGAWCPPTTARSAI